MSSFYYPIYQVFGWLLLYAGIVLAVAQQPTFTKTEFVFAAILIGSAALLSHLLRWGYNRWIKPQSLAAQLTYFCVGAIVGGLLAGAALMLGVLLLAGTSWLDPIPSGQFVTLFHMVYWPNSINMIIALVVWSALYLTIVRSRLLRDAEHALSRGQLELLMQQLNPHFLFNMLNNIRALILENPQKARDALTQLSDMLRYSLQANQQTQVKLCDELDIVEQYIALNKIQYEQRLAFIHHVDSEAYSAMIPRLLLQQSIENAIKHGIANLTDGGTIELTVRCLDGVIEIVLVNPMAAQKSSAMPLAKPRRASHNTGIGLANSRARLQLMYGKQASLNFTADTQTGRATLTMRLPFIPSETNKPCV